MRKTFLPIVLVAVAILAYFFVPVDAQRYVARGGGHVSFNGVHLYDNGAVRLYEDDANGTNYIELLAPTSIAANATVNLSDSAIQYATVQLTNAQVLALRATPITIVAAPGAGKFVEQLGGIIMFNRAAAYTETADNLQLKYVNGTGSVASGAIETTGFVDAAGDAIIKFGPQPNDTLITAAGELSNAPIVIHNTGDGEFGGGNASNFLKVSVSYRIHTTGL